VTNFIGKIRVIPTTGFAGGRIRIKSDEDPAPAEFGKGKLRDVTR